jgi:LysM repeat protein
MPPLLSRLKTLRRELKGGGVFVLVAFIVFAGIVFLLFRGQRAGPQDAAAREVRPPAPEAAPEAVAGEQEQTLPAMAVETPPEPEPVAASGENPSLPVAAVPTLAVEAASPPEPQIDTAVAEAVDQLRSEPTEIIRVRDELNKLLRLATRSEQRQNIKDQMAKLSKDWLFGPAVFPGDRLCDTYTVRSGDVLDIIGRRMKVPYQILMQINNIPRPQALQAGRAIKVIHGPFHAKVNRAAFTLDLYLQDTYVRSFKVGLGKPGYETPTGLWRVQERGKLIQPPWTDPDTGRSYQKTDPDYPLGARWIGLDGVDGPARGRTGFALHGTKDPDQIGTAGSRGCIRMYNDDVVLLYNLLAPLYSQVEVFEEN